MAELIVPVAITDAMLTSSTIAEPDAGAGEVAWNSGTSYTVGQRAVRAVSGVHKLFESLKGESHVVTISNASPAVITWVGHGKSAGQMLYLTSTGAPPSGLTTGVPYYVVNPGEDTFQLSTTIGGAPINTTTAGSGTHTAVISTNLNNVPESSPLHWVEVQATNRWAPFDTRITSVATDASPVTYVFTPGKVIDAIGLAGLTGANELTITVTAPGGFSWTETYDLDATEVLDWYDWITAEPQLRRSFSVFYLPARLDATITVTLTGAGEIGLGMLLLGQAKYIGKMAYQPRVGITDYSVKTKDAWGNDIIQERGFSRTLEGRLTIQNGAVEGVRRTFEAVRARPIMVVGVVDHDDLTEPLTVVGFYRSFQVEVAYPTQSLVSLNMEGLVQA